MSVSVSVQRGEWLDPQPRREYTDVLLATNATFLVNVLTLEELAAEKILGWCSKQMPKHAVDLAWIARDHPTLDGPKTRDLLEQKFAIEGKAGRYHDIGIVSFDSLIAALAGDAALRELRRQFPRSELLLPNAELSRTTQSLCDVKTVVDLLKSFWVPIVRRPRRP